LFNIKKTLYRKKFAHAIFLEMSNEKSFHKEPKQKSFHQEPEQKVDEFSVNRLIVPDYISHVKTGNTLCSNDNNMLILQDGPITLDIRFAPKFDSKKFPWHNGLVRDIIWCPDLNEFFLLTKNALFSFNPSSLIASTFATTTKSPAADLVINSYKKVKPHDDIDSFWRCACVGTTIYITYSGTYIR
jgi:hypothetical protein